MTDFENSVFCQKHPNWFFDPKQMEAELYSLIKDYHYIGATRPMGLKGFGLQSVGHDLNEALNYNVKIQVPAYEEQDMMDPDPKVSFDLNFAKENQIFHPLDYKKPTAAQRGIFKEIIDFLEKAGVHPRRARLSLLTGEDSIRKHTDGNFYRIQIPIITENFHLIHEDEEDKRSYQLKEGHVYICHVHRYHYAENRTSKERWHFIADCWDTGNNFKIGGVSPQAWNQECRNAELWRDFVHGKRNQPQKVLVGSKN